MRIFFVFSLMTASLFSMPHVSVNLSSKELIQRTKEVQSLRLQALKHIQNQRFKEALTLYEQIEEKGKEGLEDLWSDSLLDKAQCEMKLKQIESTLNTLNNLDLKNLKRMQRFRFQMLQSKALLQTQVPKALEILLEVLNEYPLNEWPQEEKTFLLQARASSKDYYQNQLESTHRLFEEQDYQKAYQASLPILEALNKGIYQFNDSKEEVYFALFLARCELELKEVDKALSRFEELKKLEDNPGRLDCLYGLVQCHLEKMDYQSALKACSEYLSQGPFEDEYQKQLVEIEEAKIYLTLEKWAKAKALFLPLKEKKGVSKEAAIYLAQICLHEGQLEEAKSHLMENFNSDPKLYAQWAFTKGEIYFYLHDFENALRLYQEALTKKQEVVELTTLLAHSAQAHYKLALKNKQDPIRLKSHLYYAERDLKDLLKGATKEETYGLLAEVYALKAELLKDKQAQKELIELFESKKALKEPLRMKMALLALKLYEDSSQKLKAINELLETAQDASFKVHLLKTKIEELLKQEDSFSLQEELWSATDELWQHSKAWSTEEFIYFLQATMDLYLAKGNQKGLKEAHQFLVELEKGDQQSPPSEKALYLSYQKALLESQLDQEGPSKSFLALEKILKYSQDERLKADSLFLMGSLYQAQKDYSKAQKYYTQLLEEYPKSELAAQTLYWLAEGQDQKQPRSKASQMYRRRLFHEFKNSPYAERAYFAFYPIEEYEKGEAKAIEHLEQMEDLFPTSNYLILARYLRALSSQGKQQDAALFLYQSASALFLEKREKKEVEAKALFIETFLLAELARAKLIFAQAEMSSKSQREGLFAKCIEIYQQALEEIKQQAELKLKKPSLVQQLESEAKYHLAKALIKNFQLLEGQSYLYSLLEQKDLENGYYVSKAWYELALIAFAKQEFVEALEHLKKSRESQDSKASPDQQMELAVQEALCYKALQEYDQALLCLSEVINHPKESATKVKAMLFRAEIFSMQGKEDLAQKQLIEAAQKGGNWGKMAQDRLVAQYGVDSFF